MHITFKVNDKHHVEIAGAENVPRKDEHVKLTTKSGTIAGYVEDVAWEFDESLLVLRATVFLREYR